MPWRDISIKGRRTLLAAVGREADPTQEPPREWFASLSAEDVAYLPVGITTTMELARWIREVPRVQIGCALYRHFDAGSKLLYVGIALKPLNRQVQHSNLAPWFDKVVRIEIERFDSVETARAAELRAIREENPIHNIMRPACFP